MEKLLRIIKSRYFWAALVIILEFAMLITVYVLLYNYFVPFLIMSYITYFGVFLYILNKQESPDLKLPWVIILLLLSHIGGFVYILICGSDRTTKLQKKFIKVKSQVRKDINFKMIKKQDDEVSLQVNYLKYATDLPVYTNTDVKYYSLGEYFLEDLLEDLRNAKKFIFMEYFIIEEGKMWDSIHEILKSKVDEGVEVYVMYDDFGCISTLNEHYYKELESVGIHSMPSNIFKAELSSFYNNRDHRKITVIDGIIGYSGGINIADEYINEKVKYGHWKDTAVRLSGSAVQNLTVLFLEIWNTLNKNELKYNRYLDVEYPVYESEGLVMPYGDGPEAFYEDTVGKNVYLNMINDAKKYLYIATPYLICDYELLNALCLAAKKGVDVRILVPHIPDKKTVFLMTRSSYEVLIKSGVQVYEYTPGFVHAKNCIVDDLFATCGTINLDYRSLVHHFECGVWMYKVDAIKAMKKDYLNTLSNSHKVSLKEAKLKGIKKLFAEVMKMFSPLL